MSWTELLCIAVTAAAAILCAAAVIWQRVKTERTVDRIAAMLENAKQGKLQESVFDESKLSALETQFYDYLLADLAERGSLSEEEERVKGLISDISHQTKTPIANILLYSQLLEEKFMGEDLEYLRRLTAQAEKLDFLIQSLIKTSRLENGIIKVCPAYHETARLLEEAEAQLRPRAQEKGIEFITDFTDCIGHFDPKWTLEALLNVGDNALKYTPPGGEVRISNTVYEMFIRIDVEDTGIGLREEERSKIFQRFYRSADVSGTEGTGIGLYLAREILSKEGGYIKVSPNRKKGRGCIFSLFLSKPLDFRNHLERRL